MTSRTLKNHPYAKATVIVDNITGNTALISYKTTVIVIDGEGWMSCTGTYSATTRRQIGWFMRELGLDYYTAKRCYVEGMEYNIYTGEIRQIEG